VRPLRCGASVSAGARELQAGAAATEHAAGNAESQFFDDSGELPPDHIAFEAEHTTAAFRRVGGEFEFAKLLTKATQELLIETFVLRLVRRRLIDYHLE
jgi:hypothetical protein